MMSTKVAVLRVGNLLVFSLLLLAICGGCQSEPPIDQEAWFDHEVETVWKEKFPWTPAIPFFEKGGLYVQMGDQDETPFDRPYVLPLLQKLEREFSLDWQAAVKRDKQNFAVAVMAKLPADPAIRERIVTALEEHQKTFPGAILQQWGHQWLSIDFLTAEQDAYLEGGVLPPRDPKAKREVP